MSFVMDNAFANRICGMKPAVTVQPNKQTVCARGPWYEHQYIDNDGLVIDCLLDYEAAERDTQDSHGRSESIDLIYALVNGVDIAEVISDDVKGLIEEAALQSMVMDKWNSDYDRGAELAEERAGCEA